MTAQPTPTQPIPLDPATLATIVRVTLDALPHHPHATADEQATRREAALLAVTSQHPRDPLEAMLAARSVAAWYATMDSFREAVQPDLPLVLKLRVRGKAVALSRLTTTTHQELQKRQAGPPAHPVPVPAQLQAPRPQPAPPPSLPSPHPRAPHPRAPLPAPRNASKNLPRPPAATQAAPPGFDPEQVLAELAARCLTSPIALATLKAEPRAP